jgi:type III secretion protein T
MSHSLLETLFHDILALGVAIARLFPCLLIAPAFGFTLLKGMVRTIIVIALSLFIAPQVLSQLQPVMENGTLLLALLIKEVLIGMLLGMFIALPFWLFESVGALFDNQRGALIGGQINPTLGPDATPLGHMLMQWLIITLILTFGLKLLTQILWDSYRLWPVADWFPPLTEQGFLQMMKLVGSMFSNIVLFAGPLVLVLLFIDFVIGVISLYSQQLQASVLTSPLKCLAGILFLLAYLPTLHWLAGEQLGALRDLLPMLKPVMTRGGAG